MQQLSVVQYFYVMYDSRVLHICGFEHILKQYFLYSANTNSVCYRT